MRPLPGLPAVADCFRPQQCGLQALDGSRILCQCGPYQRAQSEPKAGVFDHADVEVFSGLPHTCEQIRYGLFQHASIVEAKQILHAPRRVQHGHDLCDGRLVLVQKSGMSLTLNVVDGAQPQVACLGNRVMALVWNHRGPSHLPLPGSFALPNASSSYVTAEASGVSRPCGALDRLGVDIVPTGMYSSWDGRSRRNPASQRCKRASGTFRKVPDGTSSIAGPWLRKWTGCTPDHMRLPESLFRILPVSSGIRSARCTKDLPEECPSTYRKLPGAHDPRASHLPEATGSLRMRAPLGWHGTPVPSGRDFR